MNSIFNTLPKGWKLVPAEPTPEIIAGAALACWPTASASDIALARQAAPIVLMKMDAATGFTVDMLASTIATMAPAYRAMIAAAPMPAAEQQPSAAVMDVLAERRRQVDVEGFTPQHDDQYLSGEMPAAAACLASHGLIPYRDPEATPPAWPWAADWWKPKTHRSNLVRAGALLIAEIERIDRAAKKAKEGRRE